MDAQQCFGLSDRKDRLRMMAEVPHCVRAVNGNRAECCKECKSPFPKRVKKSDSIDVSHLLPAESPLEDGAEG